MPASSYLSQRAIESFNLRSLYLSNPNAAILAEEGKGGGANLYQFASEAVAKHARSELVDSGKYEARNLVVYTIDEAIEAFCD